MREIFEQIAPWNNYSSENKQIAAENQLFEKGNQLVQASIFGGSKC